MELQRLRIREPSCVDMEQHVLGILFAKNFAPLVMYDSGTAQWISVHAGLAARARGLFRAGALALRPLCTRALFSDLTGRRFVHRDRCIRIPNYRTLLRVRGTAASYTCTPPEST